MAVRGRHIALCGLCCLLLAKVSVFCGLRAASPPFRPRTRTSRASSVVSFDLDDTLWPVVPVIEQANQQIAKAHGQLAAEEVHDAMRRIRRQPAWENRSYADVRCAAYADLTGDELAAEGILQQWICARNEAAAAHLYPDVIPCLEGLASTGAIVGAITNGLGSPTEITALSNFFSFCVSAEEETIFPHRKPSPVVFQEAVARARKVGWTEDGIWWHVGDDLATDVAAAARLGLRTVHIDRPERVDNRFSLTSAEKLAARQAGADSEPDLTVATLRGLAERIFP